MIDPLAETHFETLFWVKYQLNLKNN
jgi:hypothetical protein